jgi:hypothetical protein
VKYCFKYIHKGPDRATLEYEQDEIKCFIDGRYIGALEGIWHIFHYDIHKQIPSIERLQVRPYHSQRHCSDSYLIDRFTCQGNIWLYLIPMNLYKVLLKELLLNAQP